MQRCPGSGAEQDGRQVSAEVHDHVEAGQDEGQRLNDRHVAVGDRIDEGLPDSRVVEDVLDEDNPAGYEETIYGIEGVLTWTVEGNAFGTTWRSRIRFELTPLSRAIAT